MLGGWEGSYHRRVNKTIKERQSSKVGMDSGRYCVRTQRARAPCSQQYPRTEELGQNLPSPLIKFPGSYKDFSRAAD